MSCSLLFPIASFAYYLFEMMGPSIRDEAVMANGNVEADYCIFQEQGTIDFSRRLMSPFTFFVSLGNSSGDVE